MLQFQTLNSEAIAKSLLLKDQAKKELELISDYNFNIFNLQNATKGNELLAVISHIFAVESIFDDLPIATEKFIPFRRKIQNSYNSVQYHNKTHGADLA